MRRFTIIWVAVLWLGACGFQLRGVMVLPEQMATTFIDTEDRFSDLYHSLRRGLEANDVRVVEDRQAASAVLHIRRDESGERVLSVSARNIPREFEVYYIVDFELLLNGQVIMTDQRIVQTRAYTWRETEVLGKAEEGRRVRRALAEDLTVRMLRRVRSAGYNDGSS